MKNNRIALMGGAALSPSTIRGLFLLLVVLGMLASPVASPAQVHRPAPIPTAPHAIPCCAINAINTNTGMVTATESATGKTFQFKVAQPALLNTLKVGQRVYANFGAGQVSVVDGSPCCSIVNASAAPAVAPPAMGAIPNKAAPAVEPCCTITSIVTYTGVVTATEKSTGKTLQFKVAQPALLNSLKVGQGVYANFGSGQVSVDGEQPCCAIVSAPATPGAAHLAVGAIPNKAAPAETPCCSITAMDNKTGMVTAREDATGRIITFRIAHFQPVDGARLSQTFAVGGKVDFLPVDGAKLTSGSSVRLTVPGFTPVDGIVASISETATPAAAPMAVSGIVNKVAPIAPCCGITAIDTKTHEVTAKENATGKIFQFNVADAALLNTLKVGQGVHANFDAGQVSLDGLESCCRIVRLPPASGSTPPSSSPPTGGGSGSNSVCAGPSTLEGVDLSSVGLSGTVNWKQVQASGRTFAYFRATEGTTVVDATFAQNYAGIKAAGLLRGAYHNFHPEEDPAAQASIFVSTIGKLQGGDLPPMLDVETTGGVGADTIVANINTWMAQVKTQTGRTPVLYSSPSFLGSLGSSVSTLSTYPLWTSNWGVSCPSISTTWQTWVLWQYTGSGTVPGISGNTGDLDRFNGTLADLKALAKQ